ncbi:MAG: UDP-N-acetylglucosamine 1-carboxyvinyltransferase [Alphaproteobacteria bacterium 16-39-46]|nr:MAG: UDP-N-acetylglucosamine 1-carboxyvinyltransferase [Alphaproteobacteria bacterium 16-39-46]OZA42700.1 MAG: UDP-N-acetylglucosamine 1-carboxyvinyltransferase [Alphaproteobacteria bacterium 17-39-52]HQS84355.1 UDP-N-acetylglucosamine 1-carboxyvinyltransferase [Alphaproteobacteria bacterium]HQS94181.1 UDP-N-acetylglucosamine 1-carboxyvinyltransferase [Alphaproteobacteria bacterium]
MDKIHIQGGIPLKGVIQIAGAKNATLPLMAACLLTEDPLILSNVPKLADIHSLIHLLKDLGAEATLTEESTSSNSLPQGQTLNLSAKNITNSKASYDLVRKMRASILVLGPLLARMGEATVSLPGGCAIGTRPVDIHIKGLQHLGAEIFLEHGYIHAKAPQGLKGKDFTFPMVTVTGTENLLMAACLAKGTTRLINVAREPEISDLVNCLISMGAHIEGIGTDTLIIEGQKSLKGTHHHVVSDRIELGTYAIAAAITRGELDLLGGKKSLIPSFLPKLEEIGVSIEEIPNGLRVSGKNASLRGIDITTDPFPGFPTDLQAQITALLCIAEGSSLITETIFENRFMHVPELMRMGAQISTQGKSVMIRGVQNLVGAEVMATDLRASFSLVLAGLVAQGETVLNRVYHLDRGYEYVEAKLRACGAQIERIHT